MKRTTLQLNYANIIPFNARYERNYLGVCGLGTVSLVANLHSNLLPFALPFALPFVFKNVVAHYSTCTEEKQDNLSYEFIDWFRGFTDAEGCFKITPQRSGSAFEFRFSFGLHIDDLPVLEYIKNQLNMGKISINSTRAKVTYNVIAKKDIAKIIVIFNEYNLNSTKHLNFLAFKEAFALYISESRRNIEKLKPRILEIINEMNTKRIDFTMPSNHSKVTINWLIGFIEGDGSFSYNPQTKKVILSIGQKGNKVLLE